MRCLHRADRWHGRALVQSRSKNDKVWLDGNYTIGDRQFPQVTIEQITAARTWEIFEVVKKKLGTAFTPEACAGGVVDRTTENDSTWIDRILLFTFFSQRHSYLLLERI